MHFLILLRQLSASFSICSQMNSINNVSQWTLLSLWASSTHGCYAAHKVIISTRPVSPSSISPSFYPMLSFQFLEYYTFFLHLLMFRSFPPLSLLSTESPLKRWSYPFPAFFFLSYSHPFLPPSFSHLSDSYTCIMHGERKTVKRPACANNSQCKQHSGEKTPRCWEILPRNPRTPMLHCCRNSCAMGKQNKKNPLLLQLTST